MRRLRRIIRRTGTNRRDGRSRNLVLEAMLPQILHPKTRVIVIVSPRDIHEIFLSRSSGLMATHTKLGA